MRLQQERLARSLFRILEFYSMGLILIYFFLPSKIQAQENIPLGTWRMHLSYNKINTVAIGTDKVFAASDNGVMIFDKNDNSITSLSKLNGLTGAGISFINFNAPTNQLLITYEDGNLDIIKENTIINFDRLKTSTSIAGSKKLNHISFRSDFAYIASDYGLVVFDLKSNEVKETWRDLGVGGSKLKIYQSTFLADSIFLVTEKGVLVGNRNDNLLDYNSWKRFDVGSFSGAVQFITSFNDKIYVAINNSGIYKYENGAWIKKSFLQNIIFTSLNSSANNLLITENQNLWKLNSANTLTQITDALVKQPVFAVEDGAGKFWIGDVQDGLVSDISGSFLNYFSNGPSNTSAARLKFNNKIMYSVPGGYSPTFEALDNAGSYDFFRDGLWRNQTSTALDLTDIEFVSDKIFLSSFGYGVEKILGAGENETSSTLYNETNSTLVNTNPPAKFVNVTAIEKSSSGLWVANYGTSNSLHLLKNDDTWQTFSFPFLPSRYPTDLRVDFNENIWMILDPLQGGGVIVFDLKNDIAVYVTEEVGHGGLPTVEKQSAKARSICIDHDGYVWIGTDEGVSYFIDPLDVFTSSFDAVKPIFENRYLLKSEKITAIEVDGANRKWIGTENGVWLFNPTGEILINNFTVENSPLISNNINDIEINPETGEVFFATEKGIVSYRGDATDGASTFQQIKIFPNPVTPEFNGTVAISGWATDAIVKITDISGKLIWQTQANGGTASWNMRDYNGHRAVTGIYLVFAATEDATENIVGKIAVIE